MSNIFNHSNGKGADCHVSGSSVYFNNSWTLFTPPQLRVCVSIKTEKLRSTKCRYQNQIPTTMAAITGKAEDIAEKSILAQKNKDERAKKGEIMREMKKLQVQIVALEREKTTHLYSRRSDFRQEFGTLEEMDNKMTVDRKTEQIKVKQQVEKISHMVKRFHKELKDVQPTPEFVEKLKVIMEEIEGTINAFKDQQRTVYEELMREERIAMLEIQALEKKFEVWSQVNDASIQRKTTGLQQPLASARDITKDLPPPVAAFEKFLEESGGIRGGWDEYDHQTFLKLRNRHKGKLQFIQHALIAIPTKTEEEIQEHEEWYQTYLSLNEKKKESIRRWREKKEGDKEELVSKAESHLKKDDLEEKEKQNKLSERIDEERRKRFQQLNAWKIQKELERAQAEERELKLTLEKSRKEEEEKKRKLVIKYKVEDHKRQREEEERLLYEEKMLLEREENERQKQISAREIYRFRERDNKRLQEKQKREMAKENDQIEKELRLEKMKEQVVMKRDPSRLLQPTEGWKSRTKEIGSSGSTAPLLHMPHRATPSWRQGLN